MMPAPKSQLSKSDYSSSRPEAESHCEHQVHNSDALRYAFELSATLIRCIDYHAMTHCLLSMITKFREIKSVASYEVFDSVAKNTTGLECQSEMLFRRFPLSLDDDFQDENTDVLRKMLEHNRHGVFDCHHNGECFTLLDIVEGVNPRRAVLVEGSISQYERTLLEGLFSVYASQTALLDKKERDALTHMLNRQSLDHIMEQIISYYRESPERLNRDKGSWLAILDIDFFKSVNDNFGHLFGDEVLIHFANVMKEHFRFSDFIFRFGGEEFLVVLNQTDERGAYDTLERFRQAVAAHRFPSGKITVSAGYTFLDSNKSVSLLLEESDQAVYHAKAQGRNRVVSIEEVDGGRNKNCPDADIELF